MAPSEDVIAAGIAEAERKVERRKRGLPLHDTPAEIEQAKFFSNVLKAKDHKVVDISFMKSLYGKSNALTDSRQKLSEGFEQNLIVQVIGHLSDAAMQKVADCLKAALELP